MTIDEAIGHAEERACGNDQCAKDHAQLADWLRELRRARMEIDLLKTLRDGFKADAQKYKSENAKLRDAMFSNAKKHALHHMDEDELRIWATQQAEYIEKLKKLVLDAWGNGHPDKSCGDCEILDECHEHMKNSPPFERCLFEARIEERMRELGVTDD